MQKPMKTKSFLLLFLMVSVFAFSQAKANPEEDAIKKSLVYFINSIKDKKIEQGVSCIYPKFFTVVPRDQMIQLLNMTYNNPFMKIDMSEVKVGNNGKPQQIGGEYFSIVPYSMKLKCNVGSMNDEMKKKINGLLVSKYGKNNVKSSAGEGSFLINAGMRACAVSRDRKTWKFVILEKEYKPQLVKVLPKQILDEI